MGSSSKGISSLRVGVTALACTKGDVRSKDYPVLDCNRDADARIRAKRLCRELAGSQRDVTGVEETVEAILPDGMSFDSDIGDDFIEIDLREQAIGCAEAVVDETSESVDTLEIRATEGGLKREGNEAPRGVVGGGEKRSGGDGADIASVT